MSPIAIVMWIVSALLAGAIIVIQTICIRRNICHGKTHLPRLIASGFTLICILIVLYNGVNIYAFRVGIVAAAIIAILLSVILADTFDRMD